MQNEGGLFEAFPIRGVSGAPSLSSSDQVPCQWCGEWLGFCQEPLPDVTALPGPLTEDVRWAPKSQLGSSASCLEDDQGHVPHYSI
jgi:hypothetical protein